MKAVRRCALVSLACRACIFTAIQFAALTPVAFAAFTENAVAIMGSVNYDSRSASLADIDNDGDLDLFFQGSSTNQKLWRNNIIGTGTMTFTDISSNLPSGMTSSWSAAWGDYDGDGKVDVFVGQSNTAVGAVGDVLRNAGGNVFTNNSVATGLADPGFHQNLAWCDIDNDLDLDLIIGMEGPTEKHEIYIHGPGHVFTPVGAAAGFQVAYGTKAYGMALGDADDDGDTDVYMSTCIGGGIIRNNFFKNMLKETGTLSFVDVADTNGTQYDLNTYGSEFADLDNDGRLDLFVTGADGNESRIYRNNGNGTFTDVDTITGHTLLSDTGTDLNGSRLVDFDNDGDLDVFLHDHLPGTGYSHARKLYRNDGNWTFTDVTVAQGLDTANQGSYDSPWGDIDRDGDMDLIATTDGSSGNRERIYLNNASTNGNHWLYVDLHGLSSNTTAIGAQLYATINKGTPQEVTLRRDANTNAGTFNQSDTPVHFGLGTATTIDQLRIEWPDGTIEVLSNVTTNQYLNLAIPAAGDFNGNGKTAGDDFLLWQRGGLGDGASAAQLAKWKGNYGAGAATAVNTAVAEPTSALLAAAALAALAGGRSRLGETRSL